MEEQHHEIVIIKRGSAAEEEGHHGGAWKIAFADFMTAMMAFFLVLWIINATSKDTKTVIARYFNPVRLEDPAKAKKGIVQDSATKDATKSDGQNSGQTNEAKDAPTSGPGDASGAGPKSPTVNVATGGPANNPPGMAKPATNADEEKTKALDKEDALFVDPYASLDRIASSPSADAKPADAPRAPPKSMTDPFRPITLGSEPDLADGSGSSVATSLNRLQGSSDKPGGESAFSAQSIADQTQPAAPAPISPPPSTAQSPAAPPASAASPSAQSPAHRIDESNRSRAIEEAKAVARALQSDIEAGLTNSPSGPSVEVEASDDGLLISVTDKMNFSMFTVGSAEPQKRTLHVMSDIAGVLKKYQGKVIVRGFTDARPYNSAKYDNWRLSSARAQMAFYMLVRGGIPENRFEKIEGYGDRRLKDPKEPLAAVNRRIEILVRPEKP